MTAIEVRGLSARLPGGFRLGPLALDVAAGGRAAILGPSGCGKTTLLRCLAGLVTPDAGVVRIGGRAVFDGATSVAPAERRLGFVFQDAALWPHLTAVDHLRFVDPSLSPAAARALLAQVGIEALATRKPATLSGGEAQRLALARALAGRPVALLLDEPLSSVDVPLRDALGLLIDRVCEERGLTLIVVTHDRHEALALADTLVVLREGRVVEAGPASRMLRAPRSAYGAAFVAGATCLPVARAAAGGAYETPFGPVASANGDTGALQLVLLPGDVAVTAADVAGAPRGRVLRVAPTAEGAVATVALGGHHLRVACPGDTRAGAELTLQLRGPARLLPDEDPSTRGTP